MSDALKVVAEGRYGKVPDAFVAVVRDAETYAALRGLAAELPSLGADFFESNLIVAAFLGTRNTGGYGVQITRGANGIIRVTETTPQKGALTTQALTAPFKAVSMATNGEANPQATVRLELDEAWKKMLRPYRVKDGAFESSGGFAGRSQKFSLEGELHSMGLDKLVTLVFNLRGTGGVEAGGRPRTLQTVATGIVDAQGGLRIPRLETGALVDAPNGGLRAAIQFSNNQDNFSLAFEPLPVNISDSFQGQGKLNATATAPPPKKKPLMRPDDMPM
jgi:hypothetical protein